MPQNKNRHNEAGNVFLFILLGVVLFAALSFTIARGFRSTTTSQMSAREADLAATEILDYAQQIERAVDRLRRRGISESEISFDSPVWGHTDYAHGQPDSHKIFHPDGGGVSAKPTPEEWHENKTRDWFFSSAIGIKDVGTDAAELNFLMYNVKKSICDAVNKSQGLDPETIYASPDEFSVSSSPFFRFKGAFNTPSDPNSNYLNGAPLNGNTTICIVNNGGKYHIVSALIIR